MLVVRTVVTGDMPSTTLRPLPTPLFVRRGFPADIAETSSVFARRSGSLSRLQPARSQPAPWSSRSGNKRTTLTSRSTLCQTVLNGDVTVLIRTR